MSSKEDRFRMSAEKYLGIHQIGFYMEDCVTQLLEHKDENPKVNPAKFFSEYFHSVKDGNNTLFREYNYIHATSHNRASFVKLFWKCFHEIGKKGDLLSIQEYHSLLTLLCPDFPFSVVQKTARIILLDDALDCLIGYSDFIYAFQVQFYYEEFIEKCSEVYQSLLQTQRSPRDPVVVPTSETNRPLNNHQTGEGVEAAMFFRSIYPICDRVNYSTPPVQALKDILFSVPRVSFYGFLMAVAKSETINYYIDSTFVFLYGNGDLVSFKCTDASKNQPQDLECDILPELAVALMDYLNLSYIPGRLPEKAKLLEGTDTNSIPTHGGHNYNRLDIVSSSHHSNKTRKPLSARKSPRKLKSRPTSAVKDSQTHGSFSSENANVKSATSHKKHASHLNSRRKSNNSSDETASDSSDSETDSET